MTPENDKKLVERFPFFQGADRLEPFPMFGFECGDGWFDPFDPPNPQATALVSTSDFYRKQRLTQQGPQGTDPWLTTTSGTTWATYTGGTAVHALLTQT